MTTEYMIANSRHPLNDQENAIYYMNKMKILEVKNHRDTLDITSKVMIIFKKMKNKILPIIEQEKIDYILGDMPKDLKIIFISGKTDTSENLNEDMKK
ncbi:hypothetical protein H8356DRAFT_1426314 [Neocallimastix lanati (nom. inval.)]|nr:hypothetical protein H8356DRAFT_1426314 [Neocallimastix sp. JGI-2020a]